MVEMQVHDVIFLMSWKLSLTINNCVFLGLSKLMITRLGNNNATKIVGFDFHSSFSSEISLNWNQQAGYENISQNIHSMNASVDDLSTIREISISMDHISSYIGGL